jgi:hypothetical protein
VLWGLAEFVVLVFLLLDSAEHQVRVGLLLDLSLEVQVSQLQQVQAQVSPQQQVVQRPSQQERQ